MHAEPFAEVGARHAAAAVVLPRLAQLHVVQTLQARVEHAFTMGYNTIHYSII